MILKGNQRANGKELALHLLNADDNEHVMVHELRGFLADDLIGALAEAEAISLGTRCKQYLFSVSLSPPPTANVSVDEFKNVIAKIEQRFGLTDQPRAIVFHEKNGRRHAHCVWSRIDTSTMRAINLPHTKYGLMDISRGLYVEHGWEMPAGMMRAEDRNPANYDQVEASQAKRSKRDPAKLKAVFKDCWAISDNRAAFAAALSEHGLHLARGDRRGFVAVDVSGEVYSLSRWCGIKAKDLRAKLGSPDDLPCIDDVLDGLTPSSVDRTSPQTAQIAPSREVEQKRAALVTRQREEREALEQFHSDRMREEIAARQSRLPTGIKAVWARMTGRLANLQEKLAAEAEACAARNDAERQRLIDRHLAERRTLNREASLGDAFKALEAELSAKASRRLYLADPAQQLVQPRDVPAFSVRQLRADPSLILDHISLKEAVFTETDVLRALSEFINDPIELRAMQIEAMASPKLIARPNDQRTFTTKDYQDTERRLKTVVADMAQSGGFRVRSRHAERAITKENKTLQRRFGRQLSDEQINAINHVLEPNQLASVVGLAGAGKSTLLSVARRAWEAQGYKVHGAALAGKAADGLEASSGISSRTLASIEASWKAGYEPIDAGSVLVIDEAGMVGARQLARVSEALHQRGCKLVLVGDPDQLQPIEAGAPFRQIVEDIGAAKLSDIRRQKSEWQRDASQHLARGEVRNALALYEERGAVNEAQNFDHAIAHLVDDYLADREANPNATRLALAHRRKDVHAINQGVKAALRQSDYPPDEYLITTEHGLRTFSVGERILFTRNDADLNVRNGLLGTITKIGDGHLSVDIDVEDGERRSLTFSTDRYAAFDHGYAVSIHRAQGCTVDRSFVLSSKTLDDNLTYVALTRHREDAKFYTAPDISRDRSSTRTYDLPNLKRKAPQLTR